ncbi:Alpha/Beta hydrolase protein [Xylariaceae sp. FL0594]|nr:Alpha/Beta hydrolase protein [Xylariaceae sp. FL0594]
MKLPAGVTESYVDCRDSCGLIFHILQSGKGPRTSTTTTNNDEEKKKLPLLLFCHGYPELAYSWRKILPRIAEAGPYYCVAVDQRGYGRTTTSSSTSTVGGKADYDSVDLSDYVFTNLVRDLVCLVYGLGYTEVFSIVGHDFGGVSSAMAALMRPDIFKSTVQLSHPHHAPPVPHKQKVDFDIQVELAKLDPPRKHYKWYNSTPQAARDWDRPPQGLAKFLRGYFHLKSADWSPNHNAHPLKEWTAQALTVMPEYYIMRAEHTMPETVSRNMEGENVLQTERWLSDEDLEIYCAEWRRTGFQGALNWYRAQTSSTPQARRDLLLFAGRKLTVPVTFISGAQDWGNYQQPGALESYDDPETVAPGCYRGATLIQGAGHWVQQEQPDAVVEALLRFFGTL